VYGRITDVPQATHDIGTLWLTDLCNDALNVIRDKSDSTQIARVAARSHAVLWASKGQDQSELPYNPSWLETHFSSSPVVMTIDSTHFTYLQRDGRAGLSDWLDAKIVHLQAVTHLSTNPAWHRVTSLMCAMSITNMPAEYKAKNLNMNWTVQHMWGNTQWTIKNVTFYFWL